MSATTCMDPVHREKEAELPGAATPTVAAAGTVRRALDTPAEFAAELLCCIGPAPLPWKHFDFTDNTVRPGVGNTQSTFSASVFLTV